MRKYNVTYENRKGHQHTFTTFARTVEAAEAEVLRQFKGIRIISTQEAS